jgi:hypothetical protein
MHDELCDPLLRVVDDIVVLAPTSHAVLSLFPATARETFQRKYRFARAHLRGSHVTHH